MPVTAQSLRGRVVDLENGAPIPGVVIAVIDSVGNRIARGITDLEGFTLPPLPGARQLTFRRIGYAPVDLAWRTPTDSLIDIRMRRLPTRLAPITVVDNEVCDKRPDAGEALALWEQVRAGLMSTVVTREARPATASLLTYQYWYSDKPLEASVQRVSSAGITRPFNSARSAEQLSTLGYIETAGDGTIFHAPDDQVFLDPTFAASHCFSLAKGTDALVGLQFAPIRRREPIPDVEGTVWLRRNPLELSSIDFCYVGIPKPIERVDPGGSLQFTTLPNGLTIISSWRIRGARYQDRPGMPAHLNRALAREAGAVVERLAWPSFTWQPELATVSGSLRIEGDDRHSRPPRVLLVGTPWSAEVDSAGRFSLSGVLPATYTLMTGRADLASVGAEPIVARQVEVRRGMNTVDRLEIRSVAEVVKRCNDGRASTTNLKGTGGDGAVFGRAVGSDSAPRIGKYSATITRAGQSSSVPAIETTGQTDRDGLFRICGVPPGATVKLTFTAANTSTATASATVAETAKYGVMLLLLQR